MDIFISWSGARSLAVAEALRDWLPMIINAAKPFLSVADIDKGARWSSEIATRLEKAKAGIICLTPTNVGSHWILFEAGALSKTVQNTYVCPLLIGLKPADVKGPLAQFQFTTTSKADMLQLFKTLNSALGDTALTEAHLEKAFALVWPQLGEELKKAPPEETKAAPQRSEREMLEEMLELVRNLGRASQDDAAGETPRTSRSYWTSLEGVLISQIEPHLKETSGDRIHSLRIRQVAADKYSLVIRTDSGFRWADDYSRDRTVAELLSSSRTAFFNAYQTWLEESQWKPPNAANIE
jgi:hypothetical protein